MVQYAREGNCNQCGECCYGVARFMQVYDETLQPPKWRCRFLKPSNSTYVCEITATTFDGDKDPSVKIGNRIRRDRDGNLIRIKQEHYDYWLQECKPFPDPLEPAHCPPEYDLPLPCGFTMVAE